MRTNFPKNISFLVQAWLMDPTPRWVLASDTSIKSHSIVSVGRVGAFQWSHSFMKWIGLSQITTILKHTSQEGRANFRKSTVSLPIHLIMDLSALRRSCGCRCSNIIQNTLSSSIRPLSRVCKDRNTAMIMTKLQQKDEHRYASKKVFLSPSQCCSVLQR